MNDLAQDKKMKKHELKAIIKELKEKIDQLEKQVTSKDDSISYSNKENSKLRAQIEEMHCMFDGLKDNPRHIKAKESWMSDIELTLPARFGRYLQQLVHSGAGIMKVDE